MPNCEGDCFSFDFDGAKRLDFELLIEVLIEIIGDGYFTGWGDAFDAFCGVDNIADNGVGTNVLAAK